MGKYTCTYLVIFSHFRSLSYTKCACVNTACVFWLGSDTCTQSTRWPNKFQTFILFTGRHIRRLRRSLQHGGSILSSIILRGTFRRISQTWDNAHTLNLENCFLYLSSVLSQFLKFIHCMVVDFVPL